MIRHFNQGSLDGLCGVYAIVNVTTHRLYQSRELTNNDSEDLFKTVLKVIPLSLYPDVLWKGLDHEDMLSICRKTVNKMRNQYGFEVEVSAPYAESDFVSVTEFLDAVSEYHSERPCGFIFGFSYFDDGERVGGHWVAFKDFKERGFKVINNGRDNNVDSRSIRVTGTPKCKIDVKETIMMTLTSINGEPP